MRILKPEVAKQREDKILRLIIEEFVKTKKPIGSELISQKGMQDISSATIRNIMKQLEEKGYLYHPHTSGGRIPTDKAYRFYVDYLVKAQQMASKERESIEEEYHGQMEELDKAMIQTSKMLAMLSKSAGFVYTADMQEQCVTRVDFIPIAPGHILVVLVTESGQVKHWTVRLNYIISPARLRVLSVFINEQISGLPFKDAQRVMWEYMKSGHNELEDVADLTRRVLEDMQTQTSQELHLEGLSQLIETTTKEDYEELRNMMRVIEEREKFSSLLEEQMQDFKNPNTDKVNITIGSENELAELKNLSIVSSAYKVGDKAIGMLGIVGPKHMEYNRMISIVNFVGNMFEEVINKWETPLLEEEKND